MFLIVSENLTLLAGVLTLCLLFNLAAIAISRNTHPASIKVSDLNATQATHETPTPRFGGFGVLLAFFIGLFFAFDQNGMILLISVVPILIAGLLEDITRKVSPKIRLLAAFASAVLAMFLSSVTITNAGISILDLLLSYAFISITFTLLFSAGTCHAINLMDGLNGLTGIFCITLGFGLFTVSYLAGDTSLQLISIITIFAIFGFLVFNWPFGSIFLGDAGAYSLGHIFAWIAILLSAQHPEVSGVSLFMMFFWPLADTTLAIVRRKLRGVPTDQPDRMHFHHLMLSLVTMRGPKNLRKTMQNSLASLLILPFAIPPIFAGILFWDNAKASFICLCIFLLLFMFSYLGALYLTRNYQNSASPVSKSA